jgi:stage II sporulation protein D
MPSSPEPAEGAAGPAAAFPFPEIAGGLDVAVQVNAAAYRLANGEWLVRGAGLSGRVTGPGTIVPASGTTLTLTSREGTRSVAGPVELASPCGNPMPAGDATYRGNLVVRATGRGTLHVINRVSLEEYLKGVVPAEMGPRVYDEPEALKAQAIAARSYAVRHRGGSAAEGYDLCSTPKCQVYGGVGAEHPLSTKAIEATAGEVLAWNGAVADTLFTSTCGGRTENASEIFPSYSAAEYPYLASVRCSGETPYEMRTLFPAGRATTALGVRGRALLASIERTGTAWADVVAARDELRARMGLPAGGGPKTLAPAVVFADLAEAARFGDVAMLTTEEERELAPKEWTEEAKAGYLVAVRFQLGGASALPVDRPFTQEEVAGLYAGLLSRMGDLEEVEGRIIGWDGKSVTVRNAKGRTPYPLSDRPVFFTGSGDRFAVVEAARPYPGDRVKLFVRGGVVTGVALTVAPAAGLYERDSTWIHWTRRFTGAELMAKLRERDSSRRGTVVVKIEVEARGASGRATKVKVTTDAGTVALSGLEVRFALAIPESLFTLAAGKDGKGPVFTFYGRGWGHGVGLCQNGAFGQALAGKGYREILSHYYPGTTVAQALTLSRR